MWLNDIYIYITSRDMFIGEWLVIDQKFSYCISSSSRCCTFIHQLNIGKDFSLSFLDSYLRFLYIFPCIGRSYDNEINGCSFLSQNCCIPYIILLVLLEIFTITEHAIHNVFLLFSLAAFMLSKADILSF